MDAKSLGFFLWVYNIYLGIVKMRMSHLHEKCGIGGVKEGEQGICIISFSSLANQGMLKIQFLAEKAISMDCHIVTASVA